MTSVTLGLVSDTHQPQRMAQLPARLPTLLQGTQLILHAGDLGELNVLDELSHLAPVVAVHGNDDSPAAQRELPQRQLLSVAGHRLLLWHSHFDRLPDETEFRRSDDWAPKLQRLAAHAKAAGAGIVIYGHTHIPTALEFDGVVLINPGALASGNAFSVQRIRSVARLTLGAGQPPQVRHLNADTGDEIEVELDLANGFQAALARYSRSIFALELQDTQQQWFSLVRKHQTCLLPLFLPLAHRVWRGDRDALTRQDLLSVLEQAGLAPDVLTELREKIGV